MDKRGYHWQLLESSLGCCPFCHGLELSWQPNCSRINQSFLRDAANGSPSSLKKKKFQDPFIGVTRLIYSSQWGVSRFPTFNVCQFISGMSWTTSNSNQAGMCSYLNYFTLPKKKLICKPNMIFFQFYSYTRSRLFPCCWATFVKTQLGKPLTSLQRNN